MISLCDYHALTLTLTIDTNIHIGIKILKWDSNSIP